MLLAQARCFSRCYKSLVRSTVVQRLNFPQPHRIGSCAAPAKSRTRWLASSSELKNCDTAVASNSGGEETVATESDFLFRIKTVEGDNTNRSLEDQWDASFEKLKIVVESEERGGMDFSVEKIDILTDEGKYLRDWIIGQRIEYQKKIAGKDSWMTDRRLAKLVSLFGLKPLLSVKPVRSWTDRYHELREYVDQHDGRFPYDVPILTMSEDEKDMNAWCQRQRIQRTRFLKGKNSEGSNAPTSWISEERIQKLDDIGFSWTPQETLWEQRYGELKAYHAHNGNCLVPNNYLANKALAKWVVHQRKQYTLFQKGEHSNMTDRRLELLNRLDFVWDAREYRWRTSYYELAEYVKLNGVGNMPSMRDAKLRRWVYAQKQAHIKWKSGEKSTMTDKRKEMLILLGVPLD